MIGLAWNEKLFHAQLVPEIVALLRKGDPSALTAAVGSCIAAAEAICRERLTACGPGCPHCCVLNVAVLLPEAIVIAAWIRQRLNAAGLSRLDGQLAYHCSWVRWMTDCERIARAAACPFLDSSGNCWIHKVRPLACRSVSSRDASACRRAFAATYATEDRLVPADQLRRSVYDSAFVCLAQAIRQCGLNDRSIELGTGVRAFLKTPHHAEAFLAGERLTDLWEH